ncbi:MAG: allantoinase, partial [Pelagibacteraceae bacterium]|nr:allantoinase [Pelagibacteraceae bacterium]
MSEKRNFIGYGNNLPKFKWVNNSKIAVQFVLNYEEGAENSVLNGDNQSEIFLSEIIGAEPVVGHRHMNMESIYEYGSRRGFWRIYNEFINRDLPLTIFGVGLALEKNEEICSAIKEA